MTDWVTPVATPIPEGGGGILSLPYPRAPATCSACSSAAPRSGLVSTYSGTTSRSAPGNTTRCTTRRLRPAGGATGAPTAPSLATLGVPAVTSSVIATPELAERLVAAEERPHPVVVHAQRGTDGHVHVEVLVGAEAPAEDHARFAGRHFPVSQQAFSVLRGVDRVVRLIAAVGEARELSHDHCLVLRIPVALGVEVAEFVDAGERYVGVRVVHHGRPLEVPGREHLQVEVEGAPASVTGSAAEIFIERAGVDDGDVAQQAG